MFTAIKIKNVRKGKKKEKKRENTKDEQKEIEGQFRVYLLNIHFLIEF